MKHTLTSYILHRKDGGIEIMACIEGVTPEMALEKWPQYRREEIERVGRVVRSAEVPKDRTFRDAWCCNGKSIDHDMAKARKIHRQRMREARAVKLADLDVAYMRADEASDDAAKKSISAKKQKLRDVTKHPDIESAKTVDELRAVWPEELN